MDVVIGTRHDLKPSLDARVAQAAQEALQDHHYVCAIDIFTGMGWLSPVIVGDWRKATVPALLEEVRVRPEKIQYALDTLHQWASDRELRASEGRYVRISRTGPVELRFSLDGDAEMERTLRLHFLSADLPPQKQQKIVERQKQDPKPVVFEIIRGSECSECGTALPKGSLLWMESKQPLCLACAGWSEMEYLGAGDAALTRRATKYSSRGAVVVRFSRSRGRYERQGILVEPEAVEKAERECAGDAEDRAQARARGAAARRKEDAALVLEMTRAILSLYPFCPPAEAEAIAAYTAERGSGRVGRSAGGRALDTKALTLAVRASIRHRDTPYDELLAKGREREDARAAVGKLVEARLEGWRQGEGKTIRRAGNG